MQNNENLKLELVSYIFKEDGSDCPSWFLPDFGLTLHGASTKTEI